MLPGLFGEARAKCAEERLIRSYSSYSGGCWDSGRTWMPTALPNLYGLYSVMMWVCY